MINYIIKDQFDKIWGLVQDIGFYIIGYKESFDKFKNKRDLLVLYNENRNSLIKI